MIRVETIVLRLVELVFENARAIVQRRIVRVDGHVGERIVLERRRRELANADPLRGAEERDFPAHEMIDPL